MKQVTSYALSEECKCLLEMLAKHFGLSRASVIEMLVRERARQEGIKANVQSVQD